MIEVLLNTCKKASDCKHGDVCIDDSTDYFFVRVDDRKTDWIVLPKNQTELIKIIATTNTLNNIIVYFDPLSSERLFDLLLVEGWRFADDTDTHSSDSKYEPQSQEIYLKLSSFGIF